MGAGAILKEGRPARPTAQTRVSDAGLFKRLLSRDRFFQVQS